MNNDQIKVTQKFPNRKTEDERHHLLLSSLRINAHALVNSQTNSAWAWTISNICIRPSCSIWKLRGWTNTCNCILNSPIDQYSWLNKMTYDHMCKYRQIEHKISGNATEDKLKTTKQNKLRTLRNALKNNSRYVGFNGTMNIWTWTSRWDQQSYKETVEIEISTIIIDEYIKHNNNDSK